MPNPTDQPGWRPDPERPGMVRWWNGLGWSDARRSADQAATRLRDAAQQTAQGGTITPQQVARTVGGGRLEAGAAATAAVAGAAAAANPFAVVALVLGVFGLVLGLYGLVSLIGLFVAVGGLFRARRLARDGSSRTGLGPSLAGLVLSVVGLLRWVPLVAPLILND